MFASWYFHANGYDKGATTTRLAQWLHLEKNGITPEALKNKPELKPESFYLWNLYVDIKKGCASVTYQELNAYQSLTGKLSAFEAGLMIEIDQVRVKEYGN